MACRDMSEDCHCGGALTDRAGAGNKSGLRGNEDQGFILRLMGTRWLDF